MQRRQPPMIRLALPAGDLREPLGDLLREAGLPVDDYAEGSRSYVARGNQENGIQIRVFREADIPIQIAMGSYDVGICNLSWVEDLMQRYPSDAVVAMRDLGLQQCSLYVAGQETRGTFCWTGVDGRISASSVSSRPGGGICAALAAAVISSVSGLGRGRELSAGRCRPSVDLGRR